MRGVIGLGIDHQDVGVRRVGDPEFGAIENVAITAVDRLQLHGHDI